MFTGTGIPRTEEDDVMYKGFNHISQGTCIRTIQQKADRILVQAFK
jgi:hypothetical protein